MVLRAVGSPLSEEDVPAPELGAEDVLVRVTACAVCRTDLHVVDGELPQPKLPLIPGHEIVGRVVAAAPGVQGFGIGERVGVAWLGWTCGSCEYCRSGRENLCERAEFTGYTRDGGYAEYVRADARYCFHLGEVGSDVSIAPWLCAGLIGYRSLRKTGAARCIGLYGFGAAAHIVTQVARYEKRRVFAFTRPGDRSAQEFALAMGAEWAGGSEDAPPEKLDAAILFAPAGELVVQALHRVKRGGCVVCGGIHMSDIPGFPYADLWHERTIGSVANLTRQDAEEFLALAQRVGVKTETRSYPLRSANDALDDLRRGRLTGAAVLVPA